MNIEEAIEYLKENLKNWKDTRPSLSNTDIVEEVDKDYKAIETLLTAYEKEKAKNKKLTERVLKLESDKFWDNVVSKSKIKQIIYPTPENPIPIEVQQSEMYKKLLKEVEE